MKNDNAILIAQLIYVAMILSFTLILTLLVSPWCLFSLFLLLLVDAFDSIEIPSQQNPLQDDIDPFNNTTNTDKDNQS